SGGLETASGPGTSRRSEETITLPPAGNLDPLAYLPENLTLVVGVRMDGLEERDGRKVVRQFAPLLNIADRVGVGPSAIEQLWFGADSETEAAIVCVRAKYKLDLGAVRSALSLPELQGSTIQRLPDGKNSVCCVDDRTVLAGREKTVAAAASHS